MQDTVSLTVTLCNLESSLQPLFLPSPYARLNSSHLRATKYFAAVKYKQFSQKEIK